MHWSRLRHATSQPSKPKEALKAHPRTITSCSLTWPHKHPIAAGILKLDTRQLFIRCAGTPVVSRFAADEEIDWYPATAVKTLILNIMLVYRDNRSENVLRVPKQPQPNLATCMNTLGQFHMSIV